MAATGKRPIKVPGLARLTVGIHQLMAWGVAIIVIALLGFLRSSTEAEYAFASAAIIPVFLVAWAGGFAQGSIAAVLAVLMWILADLFSGRQFAEAWVPWVNGLTRLATYGFVAYMTARVRSLMSEVVALASSDELTGLHNRRSFFEMGEAEANRVKRYGHPLVVIFMDLDNFKQLNDSQGHDAGDAALKAVAQVLNRTLRSTDVAARLGGDEFAILLPEIGCDAAAEAGHKIATAVNKALDGFQPVSVSVGVAWFGGGEDFEVMLKAADDLMYQVKQEGKHGVCVRLFETDSFKRP